MTIQTNREASKWTDKARILVAGLLVAAMVVAASTTAPERAGASTTFVVNGIGEAKDASTTSAACDTDPSTTGKQCTLRAAIEEANDTSGADTINFAIGGTASVKTILPDSELPEITDPVTIDGYSQRGA